MTFRQLLAEGRRILADSRLSADTPDLDARVLLGHAGALSREKLILEASQTVPPGVEAGYRSLLDRRVAGWPVAYLTGTKEFMGLEFAVGPGVLVPRPDTETLVEAALEFLQKRRGIRETDGRGRALRVLDVCSGTGCVGISLAIHGGFPTGEGFWACDISAPALETTRRNAAAHGLTGYQTVPSDLLAAFKSPEPFDLIVSNPPYLTPGETLYRLGTEQWKEPGLALDGGGEDGLDLVRRLVDEAFQLLVPGGALMVEAAPAQDRPIRELLQKAGFAPGAVRQDLAGLDRVWTGYKK